MPFRAFPGDISLLSLLQGGSNTVKWQRQALQRGGRGLACAGRQVEMQQAKEGGRWWGHVGCSHSGDLNGWY